jgi:two-component system, NtrC family, response regulator
MSLLEAPQLIGISQSISELRDEIGGIAGSNARVLITGESGTGKEVVARAIALGPPRVGSGAFVPVSCAGISDSLLEVELFGQAGVASADVAGRLELAQNGTLFLNEIGELSPQMQGRLLRFFETREIQRVGAGRTVTAENVRVLSATNRDPARLIADGHLRTDFFYRINVIHLTVPPLRQRPEDIPMLVDHFLKRFRDGASPAADNHTNGNRRGFDGARISPVRAFASDAMTALCAYSWPGNVRQLENVVERLMMTGRREVVPFEALPAEVRQATSLGSASHGQLSFTLTDDLFKKLVDDRESFWTAVYPLYMSREITKGQVRDLVRKGLEEARGNYRIVLRLFNMETRDYKRFLSFLRKHDCQLPFKEYR